MTVNKTSLNTEAIDKGTGMLKINDESEIYIARHIASVLNEHAQHLNASQLKRLADARALAISQLQPQTANSIEHSGNVLQWLGSGFSRRASEYFGRHRAISSAMLAGLVVFTFVIAQQVDFYDNLENSDAFLLASELPPEAFADKGFDTWLDAKASY